MSDRLVTRSMYREAYGISDETVRRDLRLGVCLFDEAPTRKRQAWYALRWSALASCCLLCVPAIVPTAGKE